MSCFLIFFLFLLKRSYWHDGPFCKNFQNPVVSSLTECLSVFLGFRKNMSIASKFQYGMKLLRFALCTSNCHRIVHTFFTGTVKSLIVLSVIVSLTLKCILFPIFYISVPLNFIQEHVCVCTGRNTVRNLKSYYSR